MVMDMDTGEIIGDRFAKLFFEDIEKLFTLTDKQRDLLFLMLKHAGLGNKSGLIMTPKRKKEYAEIIGVTTSNSVSNMLRSMEGKDILRRLDIEEHPNDFTINPSLMFSGNDWQRAKILIDYSDGKRNVKAFKNRDAAAAYIQRESDKEKYGSSVGFSSLTLEDMELRRAEIAWNDEKFEVDFNDKDE